MHKNLFILLLAALTVAPVAAAGDMSIYGVAHVSLDEAANGDPDPANRDRLFAVSSNKSNIGFRGREVLGDGVDAVWQAEIAIDLDNGGWGEGRDSYLGVAGGIGTLLAGKYSTPYRYATERLDIFSDTRADYNAVIGSVDGRQIFNNRAPNILFYRSPDDKPVRVALAYIANHGGEDGSTDDNLPTTRADARRTGMSAAVILDSGPAYLSVAQEVLKEYPVTGGDALATKVGAGWNFGQGTQVALIWEDARSGEKVGGNKAARQAGYLNLAHMSGNNSWMLAYGYLDTLDTLPDSGAVYYALGYKRALSRRTDFYTLFTSLHNHANGQYVLQSPNYDGGSPPGPEDTAAAPGADPYAFVVGLVHRFAVDI